MEISGLKTLFEDKEHGFNMQFYYPQIIFFKEDYLKQFSISAKTCFVFSQYKYGWEFGFAVLGFGLGFSYYK